MCCFHTGICIFGNFFQGVFEESESDVEKQLVADFIVNRCSVETPPHADVPAVTRTWLLKLRVFAAMQVATPPRFRPL